MAVMATTTKTVFAHITRDPAVRAGKACIDGTRVRVMDLVCLHQEAKTPEQMLVEYPSLNLGQVHAALAYYYDHSEEVEASMAKEDAAVADYERKKAEHLSNRQTR